MLPSDCTPFANDELHELQAVGGLPTATPAPLATSPATSLATSLATAPTAGLISIAAALAAAPLLDGPDRLTELVGTECALLIHYEVHALAAVREDEMGERRRPISSIHHMAWLEMQRCNPLRKLQRVRDGPARPRDSSTDAQLTRLAGRGHGTALVRAGRRLAVPPQRRDVK